MSDGQEADYAFFLLRALDLENAVGVRLFVVVYDADELLGLVEGLGGDFYAGFGAELEEAAELGLVILEVDAVVE